MGEWNHLPKRPRGLQVKRWERMCAHARDLLEFERAQLSDPQSPLGARLHASIAADRDVAKWRQFPLARQAVRDLAEDQDRFEHWITEKPAEFLECLDAAFRNRSTRLNRDDREAWSRIANGILLGHHRVQFAAGQGGFHVGGLRD